MLTFHWKELIFAVFARARSFMNHVAYILARMMQLQTVNAAVIAT
jgi:hypothetical protein